MGLVDIDSVLSIDNYPPDRPSHPRIIMHGGSDGFIIDRSQSITSENVVGELEKHLGVTAVNQQANPDLTPQQLDELTADWKFVVGLIDKQTDGQDVDQERVLSVAKHLSDITIGNEDYLLTLPNSRSRLEERTFLYQSIISVLNPKSTPHELSTVKT